MKSYTDAEFAELVHKLISEDYESPWVEFKSGNDNLNLIGQNISAVANAAAIHRKNSGYIIWGIKDSPVEITGTSFNPKTKKKGNEELFLWLSKMLRPVPQLSFHCHEVDGKRVSIIEIGCARIAPIRFQRVGYVKAGTSTRLLADCQPQEQALWNRILVTHRAFGSVLDGLNPTQVMNALNYKAAFKLLKKPIPESEEEIISALARLELIYQGEAGFWSILRIGAILFAEDLANFPGMRLHAARVITYRGVDRSHILRSTLGVKGYASGFDGLVKHVADQLPGEEVIEGALRNRITEYPTVAIRELAANMLFHQDLLVEGCPPKIEVFTDRVVFTNPGAPITDIDKLVNYPPVSRNAAIMHFLKGTSVVEELGSGLERTLKEIEESTLPAPRFSVHDNATQVTLFGPKPFSSQTMEDRVRACYQHACLLQKNEQRMTNATLRDRFGPDANASTVSRVINKAVQEGRIRPADGNTYVPYWFE